MQLVWTVAGRLSEQTSVLPVYRLDADYLPTRFWAKIGTAAQSSIEPNPIVFDINDDGVSIFSVKPSIVGGQVVLDSTLFGEQPAFMLKDSLVTFDIDSLAEGEQPADLTVILDLEEV